MGMDRRTCFDMKKSLLILILILFFAGPAFTNNPHDVVISEIMYHPGHAENTAENVGEEYIELYNRGAESVSLSGWSFSSGIDFVFPNDVIIGPSEYLVVASNIDVFISQHP